ncbi:hypothetical protein QBC36DRAFT_339364 [Triangularia setosa]|uniref:Transmembrane protein n=1 Tax=Triangularia setosa TaxID=2587417 RepID=A0AAN7A3E1_9PEZI|nr:hypothetical protein QBC36DRAFT_339364 [Podospora setosa]
MLAVPSVCITHQRLISLSTSRFLVRRRKICYALDGREVVHATRLSAFLFATSFSFRCTCLRILCYFSLNLFLILGMGVLSIFTLFGALRPGPRQAFQFLPILPRSVLAYMWHQRTFYEFSFFFSVLFFFFKKFFHSQQQPDWKVFLSFEEWIMAFTDRDGHWDHLWQRTLEIEATQNTDFCKRGRLETQENWGTKRNKTKRMGWTDSI